MARRHHTGSGRRGVVPADWASHAGAVVDQATTDANCTVTVGPAAGGAPVFNPTLGYSEVPAGTPVYTGPAVIMAVSATDRRQTVAEDEVASLVYDVTLLGDATGAITIDHVVKVTASDDPALTGRTLSVSEVERGSRRFSRVLLATLTD